MKCAECKQEFDDEELTEYNGALLCDKCLNEATYDTGYDGI